MSIPKRIFTRTILLVSFVSLFTDIASEMLYPIMPVYLRSIGFSVLLIGILEGFAEATAGLSKGYFGNLSDVSGKRVPFVRWGYTLSAFSKPMLALFTYPVWVFFARTFDRLGKGIRTSARDAILSDETTPEHKGKVFGFHRSMDTVGAAIGPLFALGFLYFYPFQYKWLFLIAFIPGLVAILLTLLLKEKPSSFLPSLSGEGPGVGSKAFLPAEGPGVGSIAFLPGEGPGVGSGERPTSKIAFFSYLKYWTKAAPAFKYLVAGLLIFTLFNSSDAFLLLALKNQGMSDTRMIGFYIFYNLVYALFSYPIGIIADKIGLKTMLLIGLVIFAVVYFLFGLAVSTLAFATLFFMYGIYSSCTEGISKALISNIADKRETATAIGFYNSFASIFTLLASTLAGVLWYSTGPKIMFMISGTGVFLVVGYLLVVLRSKHFTVH